MNYGINLDLDRIVRDLHKFSHLYESKTEGGLILINSPVEDMIKNEYYKSGIIISEENKYLKQILDSRKYDSFDQKGYIFVPPNVRIERLAQKDIGYGILGTANLSAGVIQILETLYGKDFEEVLTHETIHLENWDKSESWVRYETKNRCDFPTRFH